MKVLTEFLSFFSIFLHNFFSSDFSHYAPVVLTPTLYDKGAPCSTCVRGWDFCTAGLCSQKNEEEPRRIVGGLRVDAGMSEVVKGKLKKNSKFNNLPMIFFIISHINFNLNEVKISICGLNGQNVQEAVELA